MQDTDRLEASLKGRSNIYNRNDTANIALKSKRDNSLEGQNSIGDYGSIKQQSIDKSFRNEKSQFRNFPAKISQREQNINQSNPSSYEEGRNEESEKAGIMSVNEDAEDQETEKNFRHKGEISQQSHDINILKFEKL